MKPKLLLLFIALASCVTAQTPIHYSDGLMTSQMPIHYSDRKVETNTWSWKQELRATIAPAALSAIGGSAWGVHEVLQYRKAPFFKRFPNADPQYWDPDKSWENKYWRRVPVQISDAKHLFASIHQVSIFAAGVTATIPITGRWQKKQWKHNLARIGLQSLATSLGYCIGNELTFTHFFRP